MPSNQIGERNSHQKLCHVQPQAGGAVLGKHKSIIAKLMAQCKKDRWDCSDDQTSQAKYQGDEEPMEPDDPMRPGTSQMYKSHWRKPDRTGDEIVENQCINPDS